MSSALDTASRIGDKLIRDTPFRYRLEVARVNRRFVNETVGGLQFVDFGRTFGLGRPAAAYAFTQLVAPVAMTATVEIDHSDACTVWLNGEQVFQRSGDRQVTLRFDERSIDMAQRFEVALAAGTNSLVVRSETAGADWRVYLQPPSLKGAVVAADRIPEIGLHHAADVDGQVAALTNWLVVGPLPREHVLEASLVAGPPRFGNMYEGLDGPVTWTIPKTEVLGALIDPLPWGTNYTWNYHNGGVAWAMQHLAEVSGEPRFGDYANRFCDFHLEGLPFVRYQVRTLNAIESANHFIVDTPLLDFTLAPSLPFIHRLRREPSFTNRSAYAAHVERMIRYARHEQVRLPQHDIFTRTTPVEYTTWVDDMFMGIPFLVQAALYADDAATRTALLDDAAHQAVAFNTQVWDDRAELYVHARHSGSGITLPHWSRCNGWATWAMADVLAHLPANHLKFPAILGHFRRHAEALRRLQDADGFWRNVLDRPDSRQEVSGTAIFTMGFARGVRLGWLDAATFAPVIERGWRAVASRVEPDGTVHDICAGTMCSEDVEYYVNRPFYDNDTHGLFAVLFAAIETHRLLADRT